MSEKKSPESKGVLPKLKQFLDALTERYHKALRVIDEALDSESMKDKIWAVDLILKRTPTEAAEPKAVNKEKKGKPASVNPQAFAHLSEEELLDQIRHYVQDWEP